MTNFYTVLLMLCIGLVSAQNQYVQTFYATDLESTPGLIELSPNHVTMLEFESLPEGWSSGEGGIFSIEAFGNTTLQLTTGEKAGHTDLFIDVGGRLLMYKISVNSTNIHSRKIVTLDERPRNGIYTSPLAGLIPPARPAFKRPPVISTQATLTIPPRTTPVIPTPAAATVPAAPQPHTATVAPAPAANFEAGVMTINNAGFNEQGHYTIFFEFVNTSPFRVTLVPSHVSAVQENVQLDILDVNKQPLRNIVDPGESQRGMIALNGVRLGEVNIFWDVMALTNTGGVRSQLSAVATAH